jgi:hypothetical protein
MDSVNALIKSASDSARNGAYESIDIQKRFIDLGLDHWDDLLVYWCIEFCEDRGWYFYNFRNHSTIKGNGATALRGVCDLADQLGIQISLRCTEPKLFPYYESFGFLQTDSQYYRMFERRPAIQLAEAA